MTATQPTPAATAPPNPIDRMKNDELIIAALCDGNKTIGEILKWARERGSTRLDMPLCNLIIRRLSKEGQVAWSGKAFRLTAKGEETPAAVTTVPAKAGGFSGKETPQAIETKEKHGGGVGDQETQPPAPRTSKWDAFITAAQQIPEGGSTWFETPEGMTPSGFQSSASSMINNRLGKVVRYSTSKELGGLRVTNCGPRNGKRPVPVSVDAATGTGDDASPTAVVEAMAEAYPTDLEWIQDEIAKAASNEREKVKVGPVSEPPAAAAEPSEPEASPEPAPAETLMVTHEDIGPIPEVQPVRTLPGTLAVLEHEVREDLAAVERVQRLMIERFIPESCPAEAELVEAVLATLTIDGEVARLAGEVRRHRDCRAVADRLLAPWVERHPEVAEHPEALRDLWQTVYGELMKSEAA